MDVGKAFRYAFEDENWVVKVLIGGVLLLLSFLFIPPLLVGGYMIETLRNIALGTTEKLPEWDDWGGKFTRGILSFLIDIVYNLPAIVLGLCMALLMAATSAGEGSDAEALRAVLAACLGLPISLYAIVVALILPAARLRYAVTDDVMAAFQLRQVFAFISENIGNYAIAILVAIGASLVAVLVALITVPLCGLGLLLLPFASFWVSTVMAHALGQAYRLRQVPAEPEAPPA